MNFERFFDNMARLADAPGVHGSEGEVADLIVGMVGDSADKTWRDPLGNLYALRKGRSERVLMLDAHMDEVGFVVQHVDEAGFVFFETLGGWDPRVLPALNVRANPRPGASIPGVIGSLPPHMSLPETRSQAFEVTALYMDFGFESFGEAAAAGVRVGTPISLEPSFQRMGERTIAGKALDNRLGCATAIAILEELRGEEPPATIVACFTVMEEGGLRGAAVSSFNAKPDAALILETTTDGSVPGVEPRMRPTEAGKGVSITVADKLWTAPRRMVDFLEGAAKAEGIPYQLKKPKFGSTNAGAIHTSMGGVACGVIACPCRYIHGPKATTRVEDAKATLRLGLAAARRINEFFDGPAS
jgi:endoglucanase